MSAIHNTLRRHRLPTSLAILVLAGFLVGGLIVEVAHAEIDCEHDSCSLCIGSTGDHALPSEAMPPVATVCRRGLDLPVSAGMQASGTTQAHSIRGPPAT